MAGDEMGKRFGKKQQKRRMNDLSQGNRSVEDIEAEQELLDKTEKTEPIKADDKVGRNDPCPCGSGKKYKKCCADKAG